MVYFQNRKAIENRRFYLSKCLNQLAPEPFSVALTKQAILTICLFSFIR
jgi:hypothetical protein